MIIYRYMTRQGAVTLVPDSDGWHIYYDDDKIDGPFQTAQSAAESIALGHGTWPSCGDPSLLGIPEDLSMWESGTPI